MTRLATITPWGLVTPMSIPQQAMARIHEAQEEGRDVHVVSCVIERLKSGNYGYTVTNSPMPAEVALMASHEISKALEPE